MSGTVCREMRREIDRSELRQRLSATAEAHVASCAACAAFRDERLRLRELVGALEPVTAPADFDIRLRARMARERDTPRQPYIFRLIMSTPAITFAAALVLVAGVVVFMNQYKKTNMPTVASAGQNKPADTKAPIGNVTGTPVIAPVDNAPIGPGDIASRGGDNSKRASLIRNTPKSVTTANAGPQVDDFSSRGAPPIRITDRAGEVSLSAPVRPMVVTMYDQQGRSRKIQLPPISFGSQRLTDNRMPVSMNNTRDW